MKLHSFVNLSRVVDRNLKNNEHTNHGLKNLLYNLLNLEFKTRRPHVALSRGVTQLSVLG